MDSRKVKGWRSRLQEEYEEALEESRSLGADTQGARKAGAALDWTEKKDAVFHGSKEEPARSRSVPASERARVRDQLAEVVKMLHADRKEAARIRASQWYHSRTEKQRQELLAKARARRPKYRDRELAKSKERRERVRSDPELLQIERENRRDRYLERRADPARHDAQLQRRRERRKAKMEELRADPAAHAAYREKANAQHRAWKEQNREKYLARKRLDYQRKKAKGSDPA